MRFFLGLGRQAGFYLALRLGRVLVSKQLVGLARRAQGRPVLAVKPPRVVMQRILVRSASSTQELPVPLTQEKVGIPLVLDEQSKQPALVYSRIKIGKDETIESAIAKIRKCFTPLASEGTDPGPSLVLICERTRVLRMAERGERENPAMTEEEWKVGCSTLRDQGVILMPHGGHLAALLVDESGEVASFLSFRPEASRNDKTLVLAGGKSIAYPSVYGESGASVSLVKGRFLDMGGEVEKLRGHFIDVMRIPLAQTVLDYKQLKSDFDRTRKNMVLYLLMSARFPNQAVLPEYRDAFEGLRKRARLGLSQLTSDLVESSGKEVLLAGNACTHAVAEGCIGSLAAFDERGLVDLPTHLMMMYLARLAVNGSFERNDGLDDFFGQYLTDQVSKEGSNYVSRQIRDKLEGETSGSPKPNGGSP